MPERIFGHIPDVPVGSFFQSRKDLASSGIHRPLQAGISGSESNGADAVVVSGGYEDDVDLGTEIIYTGQGGRDANTGKQIADQQLTLGNRALVVSRSQGLPVRVVRGVSGGYRYDGLYRVADAWHEQGRSGFEVWRYRLVAIDPPSVDPHLLEILEVEGLEDQSSRAPGKRITTVTRIIRDTAKSREIKRLYDYTCQVCGIRLETPTGPYAEAAHIRPLGTPHNGPDTYDNLLCLCPNHHVLFDLGSFTITDDLTINGMARKLRCIPKHKVNVVHIRYHRDHYCVKK